MAIGTFQFRRDTLEKWDALNPVLKQGEIGIVTNTIPMRIKIGDGTATWKSLPYTFGVVITGVSIDASGNLIVSMSDGTKINAGVARGADGKEGAQGQPGKDGQAATITIGTVTTGAPGSDVKIVNVGTANAATLNITIPRGDPGQGNGDMTKADYDTGNTANAHKVDVARSADNVAPTATVWTQKWTAGGIILNKPANGYVSPYSMIPRNATITAFIFLCQNTPSPSTPITIKINDVAISQAATIAAAGKTTLTLSTPIAVSAGDSISYVVGGAGLASCNVTIAPEAVNR